MPHLYHLQHHRRYEAEIVDRVPPPEAVGFGEQTEEPLQAGALHPTRSPDLRPMRKSKAALAPLSTCSVKRAYRSAIHHPNLGGLRLTQTRSGQVSFIIRTTDRSSLVVKKQTRGPTRSAEAVPRLHFSCWKHYQQSLLRSFLVYQPDSLTQGYSDDASTLLQRPGRF